MNDVSDEKKSRPVLDEQTFSKLLEAAYVLQEHNREARLARGEGEAPLEVPEQSDVSPHRGAETASGQVTETEYGVTLAKIVETQHVIQVRQLNLGDALKLVANRLIEITKAQGSAIAIVEGKVIRYRAVAGKGAPGAESAEFPNKSLSANCLKNHKVFGCGDVSTDKSLDLEACKKRGIGSLLTAPIFHEGRVTGALELYYSTARVFTDQDVHTCRLMAGLVTEALARDEEITWKKSLADERAAMLEALEKLQPNLAALIEKPQEKTPAVVRTTPSESQSYNCRKCGHKLVRDEQFCGNCGTPRASDYEAPSTQSKVASLWQMQESKPKDLASDGAKIGTELERSFRAVSGDVPLAHSIEEHVPDFLAADDEPTNPAETTEVLIHSEDLAHRADDSGRVEDHEGIGDAPQPSEALTTTDGVNEGQWSSAASARAFLQKLTPKKQRGTLLRLWNTHRGDIYLAIAVVLVACVIRWGLWSDHSSKAKGAGPASSGSHRRSPDSDLSFFDRMLVELGLAEAPPTPEEKGNPAVQVWVDLQTALYYCPGADLYGKTPKGKYTTQRAAQLDQFEPASRKACN